MPPTGRFLSRAECAALVRRANSFAVGGGSTTLFLASVWTANLRWARNRFTTSGDGRTNYLRLTRTIRGAGAEVETNGIDDAPLAHAVRHAERYLLASRENPWAALHQQFVEPYSEPQIWSEATYQQSAAERAAAVRAVLPPAVAAGVYSAGYVEVSALGRASMQGERLWYYPYTLAQCSITVRDPARSGSGWAGMDHNDWSKIDPAALAAVALEKCLKSRDPVALEPGRYTTILEPQAVGELVVPWFSPPAMGRGKAEGGEGFYGAKVGQSRLGEPIMDARLTVTSDPTDPECGYPPFFDWQVFHKATWVERGVLRQLMYGREYAVKVLGEDSGGVVGSGAVHMRVEGPTSTVEEMVASTKRGVLVTRFMQVQCDVMLDAVLVTTGYTRDGVWLVENGQISKAVKNFRFRTFPAALLNSVKQVGVPRRVFHPGASPFFWYPPGYTPVIAPALKVRDFEFTGLVDAV